MEKIFKKSVLIIYSDLFCIINLVSSQAFLQLHGDQDKIANNICKQITGAAQYECLNPCVASYEIFTCKLRPNTDKYDIDTISLHLVPDAGIESSEVIEDFTQFTYLTKLSIAEEITVRDLWGKFLYEYINPLELYIVRQVEKMPDNLTMPKRLWKITFGKLGATMPANMFNVTSDLEYLQIDSILLGTNVFPQKHPEPKKLKTFIGPITYYSNFFPYPSYALQFCETIRLRIMNDYSGSGYKDFRLPVLSNLLYLKDLTYEFINSDYTAQIFTFDYAISSNTALKSLTIKGKGMRMTRDLDLSRLAKGASISIDGSCDEFLACGAEPCLKLPEGASLSINRCNFTLSKIDFTNAVSVTILNNNLQQNLPNLKINYPKLTRFNLGDSNFAGSIPNEYCSIKENVLSIGNNKLSGVVPSCFGCVGGAYVASQGLFPNSFTDFSDITQPSACETFQVFDNYSKVAKTDGSSVITVYGQDFGWSSTTKEGNANINIVVPNKQLELVIPKGVGKDLKYVATFPVGPNGIDKEFTYSYQLPVIRYYSFLKNDTTEYFVISGDGFDYEGINSVEIKKSTLPKTTYDAPSAIVGPTYGDILLPLGDIVNDNELNPQDSFEITVIAGGQTSTQQFTFYDKITIFDIDTIKLHTIGGVQEFNGQFPPVAASTVQVTINNVPCDILKYSESSIKIGYPAVPGASHYPIKVAVGGLSIGELVEYIELPTQRPTFDPNDGWMPTGSSSTLSPSFFLLFFIISSLLIIKSF
ncbi:hypothetical protein ACTFIU_007383 [Dictyostelium citrinum]